MRKDCTGRRRNHTGRWKTKHADERKTSMQINKAKTCIRTPSTTADENTQTPTYGKNKIVCRRKKARCRRRKFRHAHEKKHACRRKRKQSYRQKNARMYTEKNTYTDKKKKRIESSNTRQHTDDTTN